MSGTPEEREWFWVNNFQTEFEALIVSGKTPLESYGQLVLKYQPRMLKDFAVMKVGESGRTILAGFDQEHFRNEFKEKYDGDAPHAIKKPPRKVITATAPSTPPRTPPTTPPCPADSPSQAEENVPGQIPLPVQQDMSKMTVKERLDHVECKTKRR